MNSNQPERFCALCGLPITARFSLARQPVKDEPEYCCSGCRAVASVDRAKEETGDAAQGLLRLGLAIFFAMNVMVFTLALWSQDIYDPQAFATPLAVTLRGVFRWAAMLFSAPVLLLLGGPIAKGVISALRHRAITTDLLILLGIVAAYGTSVVSVLRGSGHVYFEVGAMVLLFVSLGRWLEAKGKLRTGESLDALARLLPDTVRRRNNTGGFDEISRDKIQTGDTVRILAGERFPVDGQIASGSALVDEQMITGESRAVEKSIGATVSSGTLNLDGDLLVEVTSADGQETVSRIMQMIRQARAMKGRHARLADSIALWFVPLICAIAAIAGVRQAQLAGLDQGVLTALAVVLIACPCALGLATPLAVWTALGRAARSGVLFRSGLVFEQLAEVQIACFDKTGTLTTGESCITQRNVSPGEDPNHVLKIAAHIAAGSNHFLSRSIVQLAQQTLTDFTPTNELVVETVPGIGLTSDVAGVGRVVLGNRKLLEDSGIRLTKELESPNDHTMENRQQVFIGWQGRVRGDFTFDQQLRPEAQTALAQCRALGLQSTMLTGDNQQSAFDIAEYLRLDSLSKQLPADKVAAVESLKQQGPVAMIGDGLNDAPALAAADVGVALGCGTDLTRDAAGVCLLADDLRRLPWAVGLARHTLRIVKQNLFWAFTYNSLAIALAATGRLNPIWAALAMALSSAMVVGNSLRLAHYPEPDDLPQSLQPPRKNQKDDAVDFEAVSVNEMVTA